MNNEEKLNTLTQHIDAMIDILGDDDKDEAIADLLEKIGELIAHYYSDEPVEDKAPEEQELDEDPVLAANGMPKGLADILRKAAANGTQICGVGPDGMSDITGIFTGSPKQVPEAEVLNGYPLNGNIPTEFSDEYNAHIKRQAERLNKVMGISVEDSLDQLKTATMRSVVGVVHQVIQAKAECPDLNIDEFYTDNLYGNKLFPADIKDGLVYSDTQYPVSSSDSVIAREILDMVHKVMEDSDKDNQTPSGTMTEPTTDADNSEATQGDTLLFKDLHDYLIGLGFVADVESISRCSDNSNLMDISVWPSATTVDLYGEDMLLYLFKDEVAVSISFSMGELHCSVRSFTYYDIYDDSEDGEIDEFYFKSMSEFINNLKNGLYLTCEECDRNKFMEEPAEYFEKGSNELSMISRVYDIMVELYTKIDHTHEAGHHMPTIEDFKAVLSKIGFTADEYCDLEAKDIDSKVWLSKSMWENGLLIQTKYLIDDEIGEFHADSIDDIIPSFMAELENQTCGFNKDAYYDRWEATEKYADEYESGPNARYYMTLENRIEEADSYYDWCCEVYSRLSKLRSGN